ncbi:hypothetical protein HRR83_002744 [Exophiala dermatitidis]|uniref:Uncharacterized protein n=1 Tax=Exophiala dermatitidis TaxID=5970 RepID=A0AAN6F0G5_EXODE|nr:hypothetical protein HRR74_003823 [Exophiala dermatitidis]KAJ4521965.1 hypothetical protein HRR73_003164 [Exophiala dermatitidis]KAJ4537524.1 hypothetical protein HRR76_005521 [Exophiala dermatitidis]KAJ4551811.1 hypothetical protein HRR77_003036 [Exophiala dermatitidis]KAJ4569546.1 hypothetical protein HRR79_004390 [Exophiala dermatitidis]
MHRALKTSSDTPTQAVLLEEQNSPSSGGDDGNIIHQGVVEGTQFTQKPADRRTPRDDISMVCKEIVGSDLR